MKAYNKGFSYMLFLFLLGFIVTVTIELTSWLNRLIEFIELLFDNYFHRNGPSQMCDRFCIRLCNNFEN